MAKNKQYYTVMQLANLMKITRGAVYKKINNGQIQIERINDRILIPVKGLEELVTRDLTEKIKTEIDKGVAKVVREYGETLKMLGKE